MVRERIYIRDYTSKTILEQVIEKSTENLGRIRKLEKLKKKEKYNL
jgi:hypothetical protein